MNNTKRYKHSKGYWLIYSPEHPYRNQGGYVPEARIIMEREIGRFINPLIEDVHHRDENVRNNEISNLNLLSKSDHRRLHSGWQLKDDGWWKTCSGCGRILRVKGNFYRRHNGHNEFVTRCKDCIRRESAERRPPKLTHEQRSIIATEAANKAWITRRNNKGAKGYG